MTSRPALAVASCRPVPGIAVHHVSVDGHVILAAAHDLTAPLADSGHRCHGAGR